MMQFTEDQARSIGGEIGIDWNAALFDVDQFRRGLEIELEHGSREPETDVTGNDSVATGKIAWAHLREYPDYYDRLEVLEREAKQYWDSRG